MSFAKLFPFSVLCVFLFPSSVQEHSRVSLSAIFCLHVAATAEGSIESPA